MFTNMVGFSPPSSNVESYILDGVSVRLANPTNNDAKIKLAEIYEIMDEARKALDFFFLNSRYFRATSTYTTKTQGRFLT